MRDRILLILAPIMGVLGAYVLASLIWLVVALSNIIYPG